jgi:2-oxoisovalerate dehydrogenase E2 component (dihydrolipoyl transacylase)
VSQFVFKLPDLGEGTVEAEIVGWRVKPGDVVSEDDVIVEVMTEKAAVEVPSPVSGRVVSTTGQPGDMVPVGSALIVFETGAGAEDGRADASGAAAGASGTAARGGGAAAADGGAAARGAAVAAGTGASGAGASGGALSAGARGASGSAAGGGGTGERGAAARGAAGAAGAASVGAGVGSGGGAAVIGGARGDIGAARDMGGSTGAAGNGAAGGAHVVAHRGRVATSPAIRRRAHEAGVDLRKLPGTGPNGRIVRQDFDAYVEQRVGGGQGARGASDKLTPLRPRPAPVADSGAAQTEEIKVIGLRRLIAQRMSEAKRNIPHFAYVEEIDVTDLEALRRHLNSKLSPGTAALTYLPFLALALVRVLKKFPQANALYDAERGVIIRHRCVHIGVATQTPDGLKVPVVRDAQARSLWDLAAEMRRVSEAARTNKATREELSGSTLTITSLGKLGGIASTPIINAPEVAIIGVNRAVERPVVLNGAITVRRMMNLSSSFDHRFVDGYDAAALIQALKEHIEHPATIFIDT